MVRRLVFLLTLYLTLDVADPMMPGALVLSVEDSVELRLAQRLSVDDVAATRAGTTEDRESVGTLPASRTPSAVRATRPRRRHASRPRLPIADPAPGPEED
jgi:hypothetical protein